MRAWLLVAVATFGCGGGGGGATGDAAGSSDAGVIADADDTPDAPVDAFVDDCPNRTEGLGQPPASTTVGQTHFGDITVHNQAEIDSLAGIVFINGNLTVSTGLAQTTVTFPDLVAVSGRLELTDNHQVIEFPKLETAGGGIVTSGVAVFHAPRFEQGAIVLGGANSDVDIHCVRDTAGPLHIYNLTASTLALPKLEKVLTAFQIESAPNLVALHLPRLTKAPSILLGHDAIDPPKTMGALTTFDAPLLTVVGGEFVIVEAPMLTTVVLGPNPMIQDMLILQEVNSLPNTHFLAGGSCQQGVAISQALQLTSLECSVSGYLSIYNAPMLTSLPSLANVGGAYLIIAGTHLTSIDLPNTMSATVFDISSNPFLTSLSAPLLEVAGQSNLGYYAEIRANAMLPNCQATAIRDRVLANTPGADFSVSGNLADGCN